ncbi:hypothetical protein LXA43DRAFT_449925 [Ganoderma leucocontextum]|nr:hypothetical protein LXA43DRAFT_449655 [Ganoderma leucocontextum]KAI1791049.1 hypothetical protein LXA43DRAFT_449925 [Ganoderma leucocontextum]
MELSTRRCNPNATILGFDGHTTYDCNYSIIRTTKPRICNLFSRHILPLGSGARGRDATRFSANVPRRNREPRHSASAEGGDLTTTPSRRLSTGPWMLGRPGLWNTYREVSKCASFLRMRKCSVRIGDGVTCSPCLGGVSVVSPLVGARRAVAERHQMFSLTRLGGEWTPWVFVLHVSVYANTGMVRLRRVAKSLEGISRCWNRETPYFSACTISVQRPEMVCGRCHDVRKNAHTTAADVR